MKLKIKLINESMNINILIKKEYEHTKTNTTFSVDKHMIKHTRNLPAPLTLQWHLQQKTKHLKFQREKKVKFWKFWKSGLGNPCYPRKPATKTHSLYPRRKAFTRASDSSSTEPFTLLTKVKPNGWPPPELRQGSLRNLAFFFSLVLTNYWLISLWLVSFLRGDLVPLSDRGLDRYYWNKKCFQRERRALVHSEVASQGSGRADHRREVHTAVHKVWATEREHGRFLSLSCPRARLGNASNIYLSLAFAPEVLSATLSIIFFQ